MENLLDLERHRTQLEKQHHDLSYDVVFCTSENERSLMQEQLNALRKQIAEVEAQIDEARDRNPSSAIAEVAAVVESVGVVDAVSLSSKNEEESGTTSLTQPVEPTVTESVVGPLRQRIAALEHSLAHLNERYDALASEKSGLESAVAAEQETSSSLLLRMEEMERAFSLEREEQNSRLNHLTVLLEQQTASTTRAETATASVTQSLDTTRQDLVSMTSARAEADAALANARQEIVERETELQRTNSAIRNAMGERDEMISTLKSQLSALEDARATQDAALVDERRRNEALQAEAQQLREAVQREQERVAQLEAHLQAAEAAVAVSRAREETLSASVRAETAAKHELATLLGDERTKREAALAAMNQENFSRTEALRASHAEEIARVHQAHAEEVATTQETHAAQLMQTRDEFERILQTEREALAALKETLQSEQQLVAASIEREAQLREVESRLQVQIQELQHKLASKEASLNVLLIELGEAQKAAAAAAATHQHIPAVPSHADGSTSSVALGASAQAESSMEQDGSSTDESRTHGRASHAAAATGMMRSRDQYVFMITGFAAELVPQLQQQILSLGSRVHNDTSVFPSYITHVVAPLSSYTLKTLAGLVTGRYVVTPQYVEDSVHTGKWLPVSPPLGTRLSPTNLLKNRKVYISESFRSESPPGSKTSKNAMNLIKELGRAIITENVNDAEIALVAEGASSQDSLTLPADCLKFSFDALVEWIKGKYMEKMAPKGAKTETKRERTDDPSNQSGNKKRKLA